MDIAHFAKKPLMGIMRGVEYGLIEPLISTVISSGLETIEITMNSADALKSIKKATRISGGRLTIGAGTVLGMKSLKSALDAGAQYIVMPVLKEDIAAYCVKNRIPVFPGALTPQEIYNAWNAGATYVKVFPSGFFGPKYFKEIKGPFEGIKLLACGGVTPENIALYRESGADAFAFGSSVFKKEWLDKRDFKSIGKRIKDYLKNL